MSGREVIAVVVVVVALATAVVGVVLIARGEHFSRPVRVQPGAPSRSQRRVALGTIRAGAPPASGEQELVASMAGGLAGQGGVVLTYAGLALTCVSLALGPLSSVVVLLAAVAAVGNAAVAVVVGVGWRRGRSYLDAHPHLQPSRGPR